MCISTMCEKTSTIAEENFYIYLPIDRNRVVNVKKEIPWSKYFQPTNPNNPDV